MKKLLLLLLLFPVSDARSQTVDVQYQAWLRYQPKWVVNERWQVKSDIDERIFIFPAKQHQYMFRVQGERILNAHWKLSAGGSFFQRYISQDTDLPDSGTKSEIRPELESNAGYPIGEKWSWQQRFRADFRFFQSENEFSYGHTRFRYLTGVRYQFNDDLSLFIWDELLLNWLAVNEVNTFDQNRIGTSMQWRWTEQLSWELTYFNWYQLRSTPDTYYNRHIVRLAFQHRFGQ